MIHNVVLTKWLESANINIVELIGILQHNKPLRSMEIFDKLKKKDPLLDQKFAQFSKILCSVLPREGLVDIITTKDGTFYTISVPTTKEKRGKK
jgi:hypothetical protein